MVVALHILYYLEMFFHQGFFCRQHKRKKAVVSDSGSDSDVVQKRKKVKIGSGSEADSDAEPKDSG